MNLKLAFTDRLFLLRLACVATMVLFSAPSLRAGGPRSVAGSSYFDSSVTAQPVTWSQGTITYYTDQGDLSSILPNASANSLVATAFAQWSSIPTAALAVTSGGTLAEDVDGSNVTVNADSSISMPADIQSTSTGTPLGIVYDYDGSVTNALMGAGAGDSSQCFANAVFGGTDNYSSFANYQHALIVINGQCAQQSSQLADVQYRLLRVIGSVLGLGWSQVNVNVQTGSPLPTSADFAGFPLMHMADARNCVPITLCYPNPLQISMDDAAAISRLYPVTAQNLPLFPGKQVFSASTARIHGSVYFTDTHGNRTQPMQGVNVVARWIDPSTGQPSRHYVASSVSGFLFTGNEGNPITGTDDSLGNPLADWGSDNTTLEGFFDLSGLQLPGGGATQYQLTVEALNPEWSAQVGSYAPGPVSPSGTAQPVTITVSAGSNVQQDILMSGSAQPIPQASSWTSPASLPLDGDWVSTLGSYDAVHYFSLSIQSNRTLSIAVTPLDASGSASELKTQPVIGLWSASDPQGTAPPAFTPSPFNQLTFALTRLDAQVSATGNYILGISDARGDGRPDYRYHARVLYADRVSPSRVGVNGGAITILGTGFAPGLAATIGSTVVAPLAITAGQVILPAPPASDGLQSVTLTDPSSGASSTMLGALAYGAAPTDNLVLLNGLNPSTPVGIQSAKPVAVRVLAADESTPVAGATIGWNANNGMQLSACKNVSSCSVTTDENGYAATWLTPAVIGTSLVTATLAPGVYSPAQSVSAALSGTETSSDIGVTTPNIYISLGATASLPLTAHLVSNGLARTNVQVNFSVVGGSGSLSASSAQTNSSGYATVSLSVTQIAAPVQVTACVAPGNVPCSTVYVVPVPVSQQIVQPVAGLGQISADQPFQSVTVRVTDSASPLPNPVVAAPVVFQTTVLRPQSSYGETGIPVMPIILAVSQTTVASDLNGIASILPSARGFSPPLEVDVGVTTGNVALDFPLELLP